TRETAAARAITWALVAHQLLMTRTMAVASAKEMVVWLLGKDQLPGGGQDGSSTTTRQGRSWASTALMTSLEPEASITPTPAASPEAARPRPVRPGKKAATARPAHSVMIRGSASRSGRWAPD